MTFEMGSWLSQFLLSAVPSAYLEFCHFSTHLCYLQVPGMGMGLTEPSPSLITPTVPLGASLNFQRAWALTMAETSFTSRPPPLLTWLLGTLG